MLALAVHSVALGLAVVTAIPALSLRPLIPVVLWPGGGNHSETTGAPPAAAGRSELAAAAVVAGTQRQAPRPAAQRNPRARAAAPPPTNAARPRRPVPDTSAVTAGDGDHAARPAAGQLGPGTGTAAGAAAENGADQRGACVYCPEPSYPLIARTRGWQGSVHIGLSVLPDGRVSDVSLRESSGYDVLDRAAVAVARRSRFRPPAASGWASPLRGRIEYRFQLSDNR